MRPLVFALPGNEAFVRLLRPALAGDPGELDMRRFPDGESYVRVDTPVYARRTLVVCTLARPDEQIPPLLFLAATLRERGAASVRLVAPYLAYMRQDTEFQLGEAVTARHFARLVSSAFDGLVTADPHLHRIAALEAVYHIPARAVHTAPRLSAWIRDNVPKPVIIGPDEESEQWVAAIARDAGAPYLVFEKTRHGDRDVALKLPALRVARERTPVLVDDIIASAHTMIAACAELIAAGIGAPICVGIHAIFAEDAYEALWRAGARRIVTTNTVPHESNEIDVSGLFVPAIATLLSEGAGRAADPNANAMEQGP